MTHHQSFYLDAIRPDHALTRQALRMAAAAARSSLDPSTQNGGLLLVAKNSECHYAFEGYNRFARGVTVTPERLQDREFKMRATVHAETATLHNARQRGVHPSGGTLYCLWAPCCGCARDLLEAGVRRLVVLRKTDLMTPARWRGDIDHAVAMYVEGGGSIEYFEEDLGFEEPLRFNGEEWIEACTSIASLKERYGVPA